MRMPSEPGCWKSGWIGTRHGQAGRTGRIFVPPLRLTRPGA
nr:MAG TPA: hypothetical protein [Caudoviricetes sp.]